MSPEIFMWETRVGQVLETGPIRTTANMRDILWHADRATLILQTPVRLKSGPLIDLLG